MFKGLSDELRHYSRNSKPQENTHNNIFGEPDAEIYRPRPKTNQQNSPNVSGVMGTLDAIDKEKVAGEKAAGDTEKATEIEGKPIIEEEKSAPVIQQQSTERRHIPPGGYSNGLW